MIKRSTGGFCKRCDSPIPSDRGRHLWDSKMKKVIGKFCSMKCFEAHCKLRQKQGDIN